MSINPNSQSQFEFFPGPSKNESHESPARNPFAFRGLTLSLDNLVVLCIIFIICLVVFFSFGVERGKRLAAEQLKIDPIALDKVIKQKDALQEPVVEQVHKISIEQEPKPASAAVPKEEDKREVLELDIQEENLYTIQVASFKLEKNAKKEADTLKGKGHETFVVPKGSYSIVCVGKFPEKMQAKTYTDKLDRRYKDYLIRRL